MRWLVALLVVSALIPCAAPAAQAQGGHGKTAAAKKRPKGAAKKKSEDKAAAEEQPSAAEQPKEAEADASKKDAEASKKEAEKKKAPEPERKVQGEKPSGGGPSGGGPSGGGPSVVEVEQGGEEGVKTYKFGPVEVEGRLKAPQVVYFMRRVRAEFAAGLLGHRSFLRELGDTRRSPSLR